MIPTRQDTLIVGDLSLHSAMRLIWTDGEPVQIQPALFRVLERLAQRAEQLVPREVLALLLSGTDEAVAPKVLDVQICRLRGRLADLRSKLKIRCLYGTGYVLTAGNGPQAAALTGLLLTDNERAALGELVRCSRHTHPHLVARLAGVVPVFQASAAAAA